MTGAIQSGSWDEIQSAVDSHSRFVISSHINPDGDAVGSALALKRILERRGKDVLFVMEKPLGCNFTPFLKHGNECIAFEPVPPDLSDRDALIMTDAGLWKRLGKVGDVYEKHPGQKICIDHHPPPSGDFPGVRIIDTKSPSTTVMIYHFLRHLGMELTLDTAEPIYLGMIVDTQNFHLPNTTVETHHIAAKCLEAGVHPTKVYDPVFGTNRFTRLRLMSLVFHTIKVYCDGKLAVMHTSQDMFKESQADPMEDEGFSDLVRTIEGVRVGIYLREEPDQKVKVSWRAKGDNNVAVSANHFGGGGHVRAAGAQIKGSIDEVREMVIEEMTKRVENGEIV